MKTSWMKSSFVALPQMKAPMLLTVVSEVITAAKAHMPTPPPDPNVSTALESLVNLRERLANVLNLRDVDPAVSTQRLREAHAVLRDAWHALSTWTQSRRRLPVTTPGYTPVRAMAATVFEPSRLAWLSRRRHEVWAESSRRIAALEQGGFVATIESLGAGDILTSLRAAHIQFGERLGVTTAASETRKVAQIMSDAREGLRRYVVCVGASAVAGGDASVTLGEKLLFPVQNVPKPLRKAKVVEGEKGASGAAPGAAGALGATGAVGAAGAHPVVPGVTPAA